MRAWDKKEGFSIFLDKLQTTDDKRNTIMLDGGSVSLQSKNRGISISIKKEYAFFTLLSSSRV
jgi:hypothetical protein